MIAFYPILEYVSCNDSCRQSICSAMNSTETYKQMLSEVHKLANSLVLDYTCKNVNLRSEKPFSALKRLLTTYMYEQRRTTSTLIIACMLLQTHHQEITDDLELVQVAETSLMPTTNAKDILDQSITFLSILKTFCIFYIHHSDSIISVR